MRTTRSTLTFKFPFTLSGIDRLFEPGTYAIETDEEVIPDISFVAYRHVETRLTASPSARFPGITITYVVDRRDLAEAQSNDKGKP